MSSLTGLLTNPTVIGNGIGGAFSYAGGKANALANEDASKLQFKATEEALADARAQRAWQQQQYTNTLQRLAPYSAAGNESLSIAQALLRSNPYAKGASAFPVQMPTYSQASPIATALTKGQTNG